MFDPSASESSPSASPTADIDAMQALGRVLTDEVAPLREPAMVLISALLTGEEGPSLLKRGRTCLDQGDLPHALDTSRDQGLRHGDRAGRAPEAAWARVSRLEPTSPQQDR
jgi:hypothetical protein